MIEAAGWCGRVMGVTLADYCSDNARQVQTQIDAFNAVGGADALEYVAGDPALLGLIWMARVRKPGVDLPDDEPWQVEELGLLQPEDYERIVAEGWRAFSLTYFAERVGGVLEAAEKRGEDMPAIMEKIEVSGVPYLVGSLATMPFEYLCGGRSFSQFVFDLYRMPDKIEAAMRVMIEGESATAIESCEAMGLPGVWVGGWRGASNMLSQSLWDRFVLPYHKRLCEEVASVGLVPILHLDSDWTRDLARFRDYPAGACVLSLDGQTDIRKAKEILGDHMCIMGDVPPVLLSQGTPTEVYEYSRALIADIGPTGFILHSGCDIPVDAPLENVKAMVRAAENS